MEIQKNKTIMGRNGRTIGIDIFYNYNRYALPVVLFAHGFKGFKDWGQWEAIGKKFAEEGFLFIKFNFAFNGTTRDKPSDFADLETFGENNYMKELDDLDTMMDWISSGQGLPDIDPKRVTLIGHSRGGGVSIVKASKDSRITHLITWAAVDRLNRGWMDEDKLAEWKKEGVYHITNTRTKQQMPLFYQLYENYKENEELLNIEAAAKSLKQKCLVVHGSKDSAVEESEANNLHEWIEGSELKIIDGANHVFGGKHPFEKKNLPKHSQELLKVCLQFLSDETE